MIAFAPCPNSAPGAQGKAPMRRKRYQRGSLKTSGRRPKKWIAQWWEDGSRRNKTLGPCVKMTRLQAEAMLAELVRPINEGVSRSASSLLTFESFVEHIYVPFKQSGRWSKCDSTPVTALWEIRTHLLPTLGGKLLRLIGREEIQRLLATKAPSLSHSIVSHLRWHLNGIFKLAVSDGLIDHNPAAELSVPTNCKPGRQVQPLTEDEVQAYLGALDLRERLMARLAIFEGMRPGEIVALRRNRLQMTGSLLISERRYRGSSGVPKNGRSRQAGLSDGTAALMSEWLDLAIDQAPDALVFPSENGVTPIRMENLWKRVFRPRLMPLGLAWATFQVLRKTNASLSKKHGVDVKVSADQRGHGVGVSLDVYTVSALSEKREAANKLEAAVLRKPEVKRIA